MKRTVATICAIACAATAGASWYWPFGSDDEKVEQPRMSELMEDASRLIDKASDYADDDKIAEAIAEYQKALAELERLEIENPERAATSEFATVRNKKAYVESAIDSLLRDQARKNAKAVAITNPTDLEKRYKSLMDMKAQERAIKPQPSPSRKSQETLASESGGEADATGAKAAAKPVASAKPVSGAKKKGQVKASQPSIKELPKDKRAVVMKVQACLAKKDYAGARAATRKFLAERPNDATALNLKALIETAEGNFSMAEATLTQLINSNPRNHHGYYNLAKLILQTRGEAGKEAARRYYENGREFCGGPVDPQLEEALK